MKRQNEFGLVGSDEDSLMENTHLEMKYCCDDKYHNCVTMESLASNNKHSSKVCFFPILCNQELNCSKMYEFFFNALFKPNETKETRNECTTDRSY